MRRLRDGEVTSIRALARGLDLDHRHVTRALPVAFLAPDIIRSILDGRQPLDLTVTTLKLLDPLPMRWNEQRLARRLRLRGPTGAKDEFHLAATAKNLRKLAKLIPMRGDLQPA